MVDSVKSRVKLSVDDVGKGPTHRVPLCSHSIAQGDCIFLDLLSKIHG